LIIPHRNIGESGSRYTFVEFEEPDSAHKFRQAWLFRHRFGQAPAALFQPSSAPWVSTLTCQAIRLTSAEGGR
jgi:hypothetical protein